MTQTKRPDHGATAREEIADLEPKRGLVAAEQRGLGDLMARYFDRMDPEARGLYSEWAEVPSAEVLERQKDVEALIPDPDPDRLMPPAAANT